jgi:hypothetical protein
LSCECKVFTEVKEEKKEGLFQLLYIDTVEFSVDDTFGFFEANQYPDKMLDGNE